MAETPFFNKVRAIQFTGANTAEIKAATEATMGPSIVVTLTNVTSTAFTINYAEGSNPIYASQTRALNDWAVWRGPDTEPSFYTPTELATRFLSYPEVMALLAPSLPAAVAASRTTDLTVVRSIVTGTGATGFQVSATRAAEVNYKVSTSTTATIGGASTATVVLEVCPTNSATAGDWKEIGRVSNSQTITLAVALQSVQVLGGNLIGYVPAGYYAKLRSITSGTASASYLVGQETLL